MGGVEGVGIRVGGAALEKAGCLVLTRCGWSRFDVGPPGEGFFFPRT